MDVAAPIVARQPKEALSPLHDMLGRIRREKHASNLNRLLNHPKVYPWVHGRLEGPLDMTGALADPDVYLLMGQHGGILLQRRQAGAFEIHCQCYPEGRGEWMLLFSRAALHWAFAKTECVEVMTRCPHGNHAAKALAKTAGMEHLFTNPSGWVMRGKSVPADIMSITIQRWLVTAPGLEERGKWFCDALAEQNRRHGISAPAISEPSFHRYIGAAYEMFAAGQFQKGCIFFNRFASLCDYTPIVILSALPMTIAIGESVVIFRDSGDFYVAANLNQDRPVN